MRWCWEVEVVKKCRLIKVHWNILRLECSGSIEYKMCILGLITRPHGRSPRFEVHVRCWFAFDGDRDRRRA